MNCINAQLISLSADNHPLDVLHIWTESDPVDEHNSKQLEQLQTLLFELKVHLTPKFFFSQDETVQHSHKEFDSFISIWYF